MSAEHPKPVAQLVEADSGIPVPAYEERQPFLPFRENEHADRDLEAQRQPPAYAVTQEEGEATVKVTDVETTKEPHWIVKCFVSGLAIIIGLFFMAILMTVGVIFVNVLVWLWHKIGLI
ncbi:hypothetical protein F4821DRAFT_123753 [Hypoxylon rubiginosum]|uniref:Uncharacterized protein n=1 Tax=Hypoxylon rubiginosum TaxID=110542 RepID=A0ACC0D1V3_9PEZI|nr:hypothetical protein F4821DRAFT_123753 [Hypoxylon rubiginosum]